MNKVADDDVVLGIKISDTGKPLEYYIAKREGRLLQYTEDYTIVRPENVIHGFLPVEAEQARGIPWLACALQVIADLRDYDAQVLDAARLAADFFILLCAKNPDMEIEQNPEPVDVQRREMAQLPVGWEPHTIDPKQPSTSYVEFRSERLREIGRAVNMPLMMIRLDSSKHSYSSARFDGQVYQRGNEMLRGWLERTTLNRLVDLVARDNGALLNRPPDTVYHWTWAPTPHVDPAKEAIATQKWLNARVTTLRDECARVGRDWEEVLNQIAKEKALMESLGIDDATIAEEIAGTEPETYPDEQTDKQTE